MKYAMTIIAAVLAAGCGDDKDKKPTAQPGVALVDVEAGTCGGLVEDDVLSNRFFAVPCAGDHVSEVAGSYELDEGDGSYPGAAQLRLDTQLACRPIFERYVGTDYWTSRYELKAIPPAPSAWSVGERKVLCLVVGKDGERLNGPARGSRR